MTKRTYLTITPETRPAALKAAGKLPGGENALEYDPSQKLWFAKESTDLNRVKTWLPENAVTGHYETTSNLTPEQEFAEKLREAGFIFPAGTLPKMDGKRHRARVEGDKGQTARSGSGVYQGYLDGHPAGWFDNHKASTGQVNWKASGEYNTDPALVMQQRALSAQHQWDRQQEQLATWDKTAASLTRQWQKMPPAPADNPYLARKQVLPADGVRQDRYDNLVIPLRNLQGEIRSVEYIKPDGQKTLKKDAEKQGNFFVVGGELQPGRPVLYAEGYATAASLNMASGLPVVMTVDAGNLVAVARLLSATYPDSPHIILGEDDFTRKDNKGLNKAREAAEQAGGVYIVPAFTPDERAQAIAGTASFSDFNDLHVSRGLNAVREQLAPVLDPVMPDWRTLLTQENTMARAPKPVAAVTGPAPGPETVNDPQSAAAPEETPIPEATVESQPGAEPKETPVPEVTTEPQPAAEPEETPAPEATTEPQPGAGPEETPAPEVTTEPQPTAEPEETPVPEVTAEPQPAAEPEETPVPEATVEPQPGAEPEETPAPEATVEPQPVAEPEETPVPEVTAEPQPGDNTPEKSDDPRPQEEPYTATSNGFRAAFGGNADALSDPELIDLDKLVKGLTREKENDTWVYSLEGERAFIHHVNKGHFVMATPEASGNDRMVLAALLAAKADADAFRRGALEITGSEAFQEKVLELIIRHNIEVKLLNPDQRDALENMRQAMNAPLDKNQDALHIAPATPGSENAPAPVATATATPVQPVPGAATTAAQPDASTFTPVPPFTSPTGGVPVNTQPAATPVPSAPASATQEKTAREWADPRTGMLTSHGTAPYRFNEKNSESYYVTLRTPDGEKTYWGKELQQAIADSGVAQNEVISLRCLGQQPVTVNVPVRNDGGNITHYERIDTQRNQWEVQSAIDRSRLIARDDQAAPPSSLSVYDSGRFWTLQQTVLEKAGLPQQSLPSGEPQLMWLTPDGKGAPTPAMPPDNVTIPSPSGSAGSVMMTAADDNQQLQMLLVKAHGQGDWLQGVLRQGDEWQHVLGKICHNRDGSPYLALNAVGNDNRLSPLGYGTAVNHVRGAEVNFDTFAFVLKDNNKIVAPLASPQNIPRPLHSMLGFTQPYTPPQNSDAPEKPKAEHRQQAQPTMQPG